MFCISFHSSPSLSQILVLEQCTSWLVDHVSSLITIYTSEYQVYVTRRKGIPVSKSGSLSPFQVAKIVSELMSFLVPWLKSAWISQPGVEVSFGWDGVGAPFSKNGLDWIPVWSKLSN